ncbi:hypothetical protein EPUL_000110 [Erysiphe pulchra]|uniref:Uncharacterized protein n=1 Tax=Erysiphe pulchra TaxID=225359 RepID=A0A2S4Q263_9PEZI|nr:hypothetical protein EPUL_000110 [Erysiphe pulchra]
MSVANMESVNIVEDETTISDKVSVNLPKENSSIENGISSQENLVDPQGANDKKEPKLSKSKKKKRNARKGKNKDSVPAPQNETKDEIKTHDSEPEKSGEVSMDSDKEERKDFKTEVLIEHTSVPLIQEKHEANTTMTQRQAPIFKDGAINTEASETKILELANLGTKASNVEDVHSMTVPENTSISLSNTVSMTLESKQQDTPPNPDGSPEISYCNPSSANDDKQVEINVQESIENIEESNKLSESENPHLVVSSTDELVKENTDLESQALTNNPISETVDFKAPSEPFMVETVSSNVATNEHVTSEVSDVSGHVRHIVRPEVLISETSTVVDGDIICNKETNITEPLALAEETAIFMTSITDFKTPNENFEAIEKDCKETADAIDPPVGTADSNVTDDKVIGSDEKEVSVSIVDVSLHEEVLENPSDSIQSVQDEPSCLFTPSKIQKEQDKELTSDVLTHTLNTEERNTASQDHTESTTNETENWKNSLESAAGKAISLIDNKVAQASNLIGMLRHSNTEFSHSEIASNASSNSKKEEIQIQNSGQFLKVKDKSSEENLSNTVNTDISSSRGNSESIVDLDKVKSDVEVSAISPTNDVFGSIASQADITNKNKIKFKPAVGEQVLAPELVTISKETLDLLYKRLDSMQLEIDRLSSALQGQNEKTPVSIKDKSNSSLKDDDVIAESSRQNSKITEEEIVNVGSLPKISKRKKTTSKPSCLWRLMSVFGYKTITKSDAGLVTRSVSENLLSPIPQGPKGKGKEIIAQPNKPSTARTYKVIGRVRAKHDIF